MTAADGKAKAENKCNARVEKRKLGFKFGYRGQEGTIKATALG